MCKYTILIADFAAALLTILLQKKSQFSFSAISNSINIDYE